jgi:hypothetical protein
MPQDHDREVNLRGGVEVLHPGADIDLPEREQAAGLRTGSGELPAVKIGGRGIWRVDRYKLDEWLEELEKRTQQWARENP